MLEVGALSAPSFHQLGLETLHVWDSGGRLGLDASGEPIAGDVERLEVSGIVREGPEVCDGVVGEPECVQQWRQARQSLRNVRQTILAEVQEGQPKPDLRPVEVGRRSHVMAYEATPPALQVVISSRLHRHRGKWTHEVIPGQRGGAGEFEYHVRIKLQVIKEGRGPHLHGEVVDLVPTQHKLGEVWETENIRVNIREEVLGEVERLEVRTVPAKLVRVHPIGRVTVKVVFPQVKHRQAPVQDSEWDAS